MQFFEWYLPNDGFWGKRCAAKAQNLAELGITDIWLPPAYKGTGGANDVGYGVYDLYDLSAVYKNIRMYPCYKSNSIIIGRILNLLYKRAEFSELNQIRKMLRTIPGLDNNMYGFAYIDNYYTYFPSLLKDDYVYFILI